MKKVLLGIVLSLITFSMVGCMHVEQVIKVNEDGSGVMEFTNLMLDGDGLSSSTLKTPEKAGLNLLKTEPYSIRKEDGDYSGTKLYYSFDSVDAVVSNVINKENSIVLKMDYQVDEMVNDDSEDLSDFAELEDITEMLIEAMDYKFSIVVPSEIIYTNGKKVNSNTVTWDMLKIEEGSQMIVEYAKENSKGEFDNSIQPIKGDFIELGQPGTDEQKEFEKESGLEGWENWTEEEMEKDYEENGFRVIGIY